MITRRSHPPSETILVISDLHQTAGLNRATDRWSPTEDFFWDHEFRDFLSHYAATSRCTLVINGDWFDFLQALVFPSDEERKEFGIAQDDINLSYGLRCSEAAAVFQVSKMIAGHPALFDALADLLSKGNRLVVVKGNHDVQLFWPGVQEYIRKDLIRRSHTMGKRINARQITFLPWVYYIPGLLYVEHGNQYEATCGFRNFLVPKLPFPPASGGDHLELDLSGLLVRYLTNKIEPDFPLIDNVRPLTTAYAMLWQNHPWLAVRTFGTAVKFALKAVVKARALNRGPARKAYLAISRENDRLLGEEANRFSPGNQETAGRLTDRFRKIYHRAPKPTFEEGAWHFAWLITKETIKRLLWLLPLYALTLIPGVSQWVAQRISDLGIPWLTRLVGFLSMVNIFQILLLLFVAGLAVFFRSLRPFKSKAKTEETVLPDVGIAMRGYADYIAGALGVRFVTFGHTHLTDTAPLANGGRYFNTGTWMTTLDDDDPLYRGEREFTFLKVTAETAELLHWNSDKGAPEPVIVIEPESPLSDVEDSVIKILVSAFKR